MKKTLIYSSLLLAGVALTGCNEDFKDWVNPQTIPQPDAITINFTATAADPLNMVTTTADSVTLFKPTITINRDSVETYYDVIIYNADLNDSVAVKTDANGRARTAEVQGAFLALYGPEEVARTAKANAVSHSLVEGTLLSRRVEGLSITCTPKYQELPPVWFMLGNCLGRGTWTNNRLVVYTNLVAMQANPYNYDELIYTGYFCDNAEFRVVPEPGNRNRYIGQDAGGDIKYQAEAPEGQALGNIKIETGGYYQITVNVNTYALTISPLKTNGVTWDAINIAGEATATLRKVTTHPTGENHDWEGDLTLENDAKVRFEASAEAYWGGTAFPAGKASLKGSDILVKAGKYKVVYNDLSNTYRFIEQ